MGNKNALERYLMLDYCLNTGQFTFKELVACVNNQLRSKGLDVVSERTVRGDIYNIETIFHKYINRVRRLGGNKIYYKYPYETKPIFTVNE